MTLWTWGRAASVAAPGRGGGERKGGGDLPFLLNVYVTYYNVHILGRVIITLCYRVHVQ